jgi:hypothetical protein
MWWTKRHYDSFLSTSLFLPHYHATNILYTFSQLLTTMREMETLCVSENAFFFVHVTVRREKFLYDKTNQMN